MLVLSNAPRLDAQAKVVCCMATYGLRPIFRTRAGCGNHPLIESRKRVAPPPHWKIFLAYIWSGLDMSVPLQLKSKQEPLRPPALFAGGEFPRKRRAFTDTCIQGLARRCWKHLRKTWTKYSRATNVSYLWRVHPWTTRLPAKLRLSLSWPHFCLSISLPHAPTPASNAQGSCGKNPVNVRHGGIATRTGWGRATLCVVFDSHHHIEDWAGRPVQAGFRCEAWRAKYLKSSICQYIRCGIVSPGVEVWRTTSPCFTVIHGSQPDSAEKEELRRVLLQLWILSNLDSIEMKVHCAEAEDPRHNSEILYLPGTVVQVCSFGLVTLVQRSIVMEPKWWHGSWIPYTPEN